MKCFFLDNLKKRTNATYLSSKYLKTIKDIVTLFDYFKRTF